MYYKMSPQLKGITSHTYREEEGGGGGGGRGGVAYAFSHIS